jgi:hypothetical protein
VPAVRVRHGSNKTQDDLRLPVDIVLVSDIPKEPDLRFRNKHRNTQCMNRRISKSLIVETSTSVQPVKILLIGLPTEETQIADFEIGEELAIVVVTAVVRIEQPVEVGIRMDELRVSVDEGAGARPEGRERTSVVEDVHVEAVLHVVIAHEAEDVVVDIAEEVDLPRA